MKKAVFLDRDGTINIDKDYLYKIEDFEFIPGVIHGLKLLNDSGYLLIIITNQSGIGRGYYSELDFIKLNSWMLNCFDAFGINISKVYYCPHYIDSPYKQYKKKCDCRKPGIGLFLQAIKDFDIDLSQSFAIGDKIRDCSICQTTDCRGFLVGSNESEQIRAEVLNNKYPRILYKDTFLDCVNSIINTNL